MATDVPFTVQGPTVNVAITTGSLRVQYNPRGTEDRQVRVCNPSDVDVFIEFGGSGVTATLTSSMILPAKTTEVLGGGSSKGSTHVAVIAESASTKKIYFTPGDGF